MSKIQRLILIPIVALFFVAPALAQDDSTPTPETTVEPTPAPIEEPARDRTETVLTIALIVAGILVTVLGAELIVLARTAFVHQSPLVQEIIRMNSTRVLDELDRRAILTETKLDDEAVAEIRRIVKEIVAETTALKAS